MFIRPRMPHFFLADVDRDEWREDNIGGAGLMVASMLELTILPAVDPSLASYGMVGLGGGRMPQSAPAVRSRFGIFCFVLGVLWADRRSLSSVGSCFWSRG